METPSDPRAPRVPEVLPPTSVSTNAPAPAAEPEHPLHAAARDSVQGLSKGRKLAALVVAGVSDAISIFAEFAPPVQWAVDGLTGLALFALLGFRWPLLPVLVMEAIPGLAAFPTWVLVVGVLATTTPTKRAS